MWWKHEKQCAQARTCLQRQNNGHSSLHSSSTPTTMALRRTVLRSSLPSTTMPKKAKIYAVAVGRQPGLYNTWSECQAQVKGFSNAKFKSFASRDEAQAFLTFSGESRAGKQQKKKLQTTKSASIMFDGGSRGNPGVAGAGTWVQLEGVSYHIRTFVGPHATNNQAEYTGLLSGLLFLQTDCCELLVQGDSKLVTEQLRGDWKCENEKLKPLQAQASQLLQGHNYTLEHVYRDDNKVADELANQAMDAQRSWVTTSEDEHRTQYEWLDGQIGNAIADEFPTQTKRRKLTES